MNWNFLTPRRVMFTLIFIGFIVVDTDHDWKHVMQPYDHATVWLEWMMIALKCLILGVAVYRAYQKFNTPGDDAVASL